MCGIAGIVMRHRDAPVSNKILELMRDSMISRGPDECGSYIRGQVGLAHRRLSIIDVASGKQPMEADDGNYCIVFNGEIYNYAELKHNLEKRGFSFQTNSDTEVILKMYIADGAASVGKLRGMFSYAIWDNRKELLFCARDRLGKKPFYYTNTPSLFAFASEIKALFKIPEVKRIANEEGIDAFLTLGYIPTSHTAFKSVIKLQPGYSMTVQGGSINMEKYWDLPEYSSDFEITGDQELYREKLLELFDTSVSIRLVSEVPLGAFLSGGVDSTAVVASMVKSSPKSVITTTVGFDVPEFDETAIAKKSSEFYNTDHRMHKVIPDTTGVLIDLVRYFDEPFADASAVPTYYVCKLARQDVTVALSGDGGDELFCGYNWYSSFQQNRNAAARWGVGGNLISHFATMVRPPFKGKTFITSLGLSDWDAILNMRSIWDRSAKDSLYTTSFLEYSSKNGIFNEMGETFNRATTGMPAVRKMQFFDFKYYLPDDILVKADRMSMINSLEVRAPLLDHILAEYVWTLPTNIKLNGNTRKYIFKYAVEPILPPGLLSYPKRGFTPPVKSWLLGPLRELAEDTLFSAKSRQRGIFNNTKIEKQWKQFVSGNSLYSDASVKMWTLLILELWFSNCIDQ
jgi:asparagine synthase (glutamine-hydrolysing)